MATETPFRKCPYCEHQHAVDSFHGDMCGGCRTEGVQAHIARIADALCKREWIKARQRAALASKGA